jgi:hypothetical protein
MDVGGSFALLGIGFGFRLRLGHPAPTSEATLRFSHVIWRTPAFILSCLPASGQNRAVRRLFGDLKIEDKRFVQNA